MKTQEIRRKFINYFKEKGHSHITSSPVCPHDDPTLLFINAGMNQFKDVFLGKSRRDYTKATTSQKCIRVGGKHNDFENVGHTSRHLTFFEMLGNFSFGDYFKKEAIQYAWEVSTQIFGFDPDKIWPTVYYKDEEAYELWKAYVPESRITRFGEEDNFWAMGNTGPCGPCTELFYDRGEKYGSGKTPTEDKDGDRFLEFWNLVFMQYNRTEEGVLEPLPKPSVDTGAGIERVVSLIMETDSVFETDVLRGIIAKLEEVSGVAYDLKNEAKYPAFRVIADHLRTLSFAIADGVQPSNVDRGYVLRKVLRRAVRYGRILGIDKPFLAELLPRLIELMGSDYPELIKCKERISEILIVEEEAFLRTLQRGGNILNQIIVAAQEHGKIISGEEAFKLKDTYGLPLDEILLLAKDAGLSVDIEHYKILEEKAKQKSRQAHKTVKQTIGENLFIDFIDKQGPTLFLGYNQTESESKVAAIIVENTFVNSITEDQDGIIVLNKTPFYAEMGGQIGDFGKLANETAFFEVSNCQSPFKGVIAHIGTLKKGKISVGDIVKAAIDKENRTKIANNHTATHLLHWALHKVLGEHIKQAGSVVDSQRLRFDFSHHKPLSLEEIREIEKLVNEKIRCNTPVACYELKYEDVQKRDDIKQFFGDKYDATVRVIDIDDFSKELCGGTHITATGNIGLFRIAKESSIAAGIRRIEAVTGEVAEAIIYQNEDLIAAVAEQLKSQPQKLHEKIEKILEENKELAQELKSAKKREIDIIIKDLLNQIETIDGIPFLALELQIAVKELNSFAEALAEKIKNGVLIVAASESDKCNLTVRVSPDCIAKGIKAGEIIKKIAPTIGGSGGGKADSAQAGGKFPNKLKEAFAQAKDHLVKGCTHER